MTVIWIVLPGLAETPEEFARVVELLPTDDVRVIDPWRTPITSDIDAFRSEVAVRADAEIGLIGHSMGGLAALRWALTRPLEVSRLVLVDTSLTSETGLPWLYPGRPADRGMRALLRFLGRVGVPQLFGTGVRRLSIRIGSISNQDPLSKATVKARYGARSSWLLFWDELASGWELAAEVAKLVSGPVDQLAPTTVLVATGGRPRFTANRWLAAHRRLAAKLAATVVVLPDSGHLVHLDRPDAIAAAARS